MGAKNPNGRVAARNEGDAVSGVCWPGLRGRATARVRAFGSVGRKMGGKGRLPGLLCQGKEGCFRSQNHRPKRRVCGGSSRAKKEGSLWFGREPGDQGNGGPL